jgi:predicted nucleic acid-binding protein
MLLIADSSALIALSVMDCLTVLDQLFERVLVPEAVYLEVVEDDALPEAMALKHYLQDKVCKLASDARLVLVDAYGDIGEMEAMYLYKQLHADRLLIDDARGRKVAQINQITVIGSIGILLLAKQKGILSEIKPKLTVLNQSDVYIASALIEQALRVAGE